MKKTILQHIETDDYFCGFSIKSGGKAKAPGSRPMRDARGTQDDSIEKLRACIVQCEKCKLHTTRTQAVPGEGCAQAALMFVGEAPGADEDAQGRPFVGRAGALLDKIINACALNRCDVYITSILKCRPPGNRDPHPDEIAQCLPYLEAQIKAIQPAVIVALGAHAARTLLETDAPIGKMRGLFQDYTPSGAERPIKLMPTYHPAYLLRNYSHENRKRVWEDMKKVLDALGLPLPEKGAG
jgi:uracil-DNA glycosylase family 4